MNIFRVLSSGKHRFREEFVSAFLAYLLSPKMDHGLGARLLIDLLQQIALKHQNPDVKKVAEQFDERLRDSLFDGEDSQIKVELEFPVKIQNSKRAFIDIVIRYQEWYIMIENKISLSSQTTDQVYHQYTGLKRELKERNIPDNKVLVIYLVPGIPGQSGWSVSEDCAEELTFKMEENDIASLVTWQPICDTDDLSIVGILREMLFQESRGNISPMTYDVRQAILSFIDFILGEFQGYPYDRTTSRVTANTQKVSKLLKSSEDIFVGLRYGMAGIIRRAWKNQHFSNERLAVKEENPHSWQYLSLKEFKILVTWAMDPEHAPLTGVRWKGRPFWTNMLYLVAKSAGSDIYIGIKGGKNALEAMNINDIKQRQSWEIRKSKKNSQWLSGKIFCNILESKGIQYESLEE